MRAAALQPPCTLQPETWRARGNIYNLALCLHLKPQPHRGGGVVKQLHLGCMHWGGRGGGSGVGGGGLRPILLVRHRLAGTPLTPFPRRHAAIKAPKKGCPKRSPRRYAVI